MLITRLSRLPTRCCFWWQTFICLFVEITVEKWLSYNQETFQTATQWFLDHRHFNHCMICMVQGVLHAQPDKHHYFIITLCTLMPMTYIPEISAKNGTSFWSIWHAVWYQIFLVPFLATNKTMLFSCRFMVLVFWYWFSVRISGMCVNGTRMSVITITEQTKSRQST